jgi:hypothetical protein
VIVSESKVKLVETGLKKLEVMLMKMLKREYYQHALYTIHNFIHLSSIMV